MYNYTRFMKNIRHITITGCRVPALLLALLVGAAAVPARAQGYSVPDDYAKACITDVGVVVSDISFCTKFNEETQQTDTVMLLSEAETVWQSENVNIYDSAQVSRALMPRRNARMKALADGGGSWQWGNLSDQFLQNFYYYVYRFNYPSVDAKGQEVMLSGIAACPTPDGASKVNNIVMGTHITITSDAQRPSAQVNNFERDDWGMIMSLAAGPKFMLNAKYSAYLIAAQAGTTLGGLGLCLTGAGAIVGIPLLLASIVTDIYAIDQLDKAWGNHDYNNNLVIMADYEGYGLTKDHAHPYLYQELTARQCVDATIYGRYLYEHDARLSYLRHPIRSDYRTFSIGYSQGGSVAMACHRFVEQNNLVNDLHFVGSICGDGPYDPMATLMFYVKQDLENKEMKMPVVLPLIVKGMLDTNPYMEGHKAEEYFRPEFLATGIMDWIASKDYDTGDIDNLWTVYAKEHPGTIDYKSAKMRDIMNEKCYAYFKKIYEDNKDTFTQADGIPLPQHRGTIEDLHLALSSNDMTSGWVPRHYIILFHSEGDNVVPFVNAQRALNAFDSDVALIKAPNNADHVDSGMDFFRGDSDIDDVVFSRVLSTRINDLVTSMCYRTW